MEATSTAILRRPHEHAAIIGDRILLRLIEFSFGSGEALTRTFRETFHDFADAYFTLVEGGEGPIIGNTMRMDVVAAIARQLDLAIETGSLANTRMPSGIASIMILTSMAALVEPVMDGSISPGEAAGHLTATIFDGLQATDHSANDA